MSIFEIRSFLGLAGYYERHENGLKLSIRDRIVGFHQRDTGVGEKREDQLSPSLG